MQQNTEIYVDRTKLSFVSPPVTRNRWCIYNDCSSKATIHSKNTAQCKIRGLKLRLNAVQICQHSSATSNFRRVTQ